MPIKIDAKLKRNIILQYTVVTFAVTLGVSLLLGTFLTQSLTEQAINAHISFFPKIISLTAKNSPGIYSFILSESASRRLEDIEGFASGIESFSSVFRVKIWDSNGNVIWSNDRELIGRNFENDPNYQLAIHGQTNSLFQLPEKEENSSERFAGTVLEIYTPIRQADKVIGVVELYEAAHELLGQIEKNRAIIWSLIAAAGILIYLLLFFIFFRAHMAQKDTILKVERTLDATIYALAYLAEIRDIETGKHLERTSKYVELIVKELQKSSGYSNYITEQYIVDLVKASPLHDVGKVGVLDAILRKPAKLTPEEFTEIKKHSVYGAEILKEANKKIGFQSLIEIAIQIAEFHHERWDGAGYPHGLAGDKIPLSARIMALADVYDALRSKRCYKDALSHAQSVKIIAEAKGTQFDPNVVDVFLLKEKEFERVSIELAD